MPQQPLLTVPQLQLQMRLPQQNLGVRKGSCSGKANRSAPAALKQEPKLLAVELITLFSAKGADHSSV